MKVLTTIQHMDKTVQRIDHIKVTWLFVILTVLRCDSIPPWINRDRTMQTLKTNKKTIWPISSHLDHRLSQQHIFHISTIPWRRLKLYTKYSSLLIQLL